MLLETPGATILEDPRVRIDGREARFLRLGAGAWGAVGLSAAIAGLGVPALFALLLWLLRKERS